jgi:hypothetical protein
MTLNKQFILHPSRALKPLKIGEIERQLETMVPQRASNHDPFEKLNSVRFAPQMLALAA